MKTQEPVTLFTDVGGVLLTNGWDRHSRRKAADQFGFDGKEFENRHQLTYYLLEIGKISLEDYLKMTLFYQPQAFTMQQFVDFMYDQSEPYEEMISYYKELKKNYPIKIVVLSNEGREISEYRFKKFRFSEFVDFFLVSSFVSLRKPDIEIFQMALALAQSEPFRSIYIDDREIFVEIAKNAGIHGVWHRDVTLTQNAIQAILSANP